MNEWLIVHDIGMLNFNGKRFKGCAESKRAQSLRIQGCIFKFDCSCCGLSTVY